MKKLVSKKFLGIAAACVALLTGVVVVAQPVIPEMKWLQYDNFIRLIYDANPNTSGATTVMEFDGDNAQVNVTGQLNATAGFGATYTESFTPNEIAAVPSAITTVAGLVQTAAAQQLDLLWLTNGVRLIAAQGTAQTILPVMDATGLDISGDQVNAESYEIFGGYLGASGRPMVVGVDPAFYFCAGLTIADASGAENLNVGWRSATQTQTATIGTYLNYAAIGIEEGGGTTDPAPIYMLTGNDDTDVSTDTTNTWADAASKRLCVYVSAAGVVTYTINGAAPTTVAAYTFDDGDSVIPFIHFLQGSDVSGAVDLTEWTVGYTTAGVNP